MTIDDVWDDLIHNTRKGDRAGKLCNYIESYPLTQDEINDLIDHVWLMQEFPYQWHDEWISMWNNYQTPPKKQRLIDRLFKEPRRIYRGGNPKGFSWTLNKDKAKWFASHRSFDKDYPLNERLTYAYEVKMIYNDRGEQEIVLKLENLE